MESPLDCQPRFSGYGSRRAAFSNNNSVGTFARLMIKSGTSALYHVDDESEFVESLKSYAGHFELEAVRRALLIPYNRLSISLRFNPVA